ncbi:hypothetical protein A8E63_13850 [Burkholderia cenocepacia]|nr:hypothetical protein A8E63_13850 [Burkholderia cenocepacia]
MVMFLSLITWGEVFKTIEMYFYMQSIMIKSLSKEQTICSNISERNLLKTRNSSLLSQREYLK